MSQHRLQNDLEQAHFQSTASMFHNVSASGRMYGWGPTASLPSAVSGWAPGAIWTDTTTGYVYTNTGSATSCTFTRVINASTAPMTGRIDFSGVTPGVETTGSLVTTGSTWVAHSAVGGCAVKLLCSTTATSGDYATHRIRARADAADADAGRGVMGVVAGNYAASANVNNYGNLIAIQGYAQPLAKTNDGASNVVCGVYSCIQATAASSGRRWSMWTDTHATTKASGLDYLHRYSNNGTTAIDGLWTIYGGGRLPLLMNIEDATPGFVEIGAGTYSSADGYLKIQHNGTAYRIPIFTDVD